jgi:MFS family permease
MGWFLSGTLIGPALGPFLGGIIVTFRSWRVIFYLQTALAGAALVGAFFLLPETAHRKKSDDLVGLPFKKKVSVLWSMTNPWRVVRLYQYPNLIVVSLASSSLVWNMYSLLTPIRYVLNPRFHLTTPIQSGLFYLAPGCGYLLGTFFGGRYADHITIKWQAKRNGTRVPEDRLRSAVPFLGIAIPGCMLIYGWSVEKRFGGIPLPVIMMFLQGVAQLFCFPSLNTYCLDVMQRNSAEVIAGNYMIRYLFAALGTATVLPAVDKIGVGWFSTISAAFLVASGLATGAAALKGREWREAVDRKKRAKRKSTIERQNGKAMRHAVTDSGKEKEMV